MFFSPCRPPALAGDSKSLQSPVPQKKGRRKDYDLPPPAHEIFFSPENLLSFIPLFIPLFIPQGGIRERRQESRQEELPGWKAAPELLQKNSFPVFGASFPRRIPPVFPERRSAGSAQSPKSGTYMTITIAESRMRTGYASSLI